MTHDRQVDYEGLRQLVDFQIKEGVKGILAVGTTGESPTLDWNEHNRVIEKTHEYAGAKVLTIAGTGSNSTQEAIEGTEHAQRTGIKCVLLVDPYYNGPSSMEIRREYIEPIARRFPEVQVIPYIIPGRTGTQLYPQDLAVLHQQYPNVRCVKEATGDLKNMELTRQLCGEDFDILSGDDDKTYTMMISPDIEASGVISVISNVAPSAVVDMVHYILDGNEEGCKRNRPSTPTALQHSHSENTRTNPIRRSSMQSPQSPGLQDTDERVRHAVWSMQAASGKNDPQRLRSSSHKRQKSV